MELTLDQKINEVLYLLGEALRKLGAASQEVELHGWEEICEAKDLLENIPLGLTTAA
jgi:hypothetical protein